MGEASFDENRRAQPHHGEVPGEIVELFDRIMKQQPERADAIVWLENEPIERAEKCKELIFADYAPEIVIGGPTRNMVEQVHHILSIAAEKKWKKLLLVASPYHQMRVYLAFVKQAHDMNLEIDFINQPVRPLNWYRTTPNKGKVPNEIILEEIEKITNSPADFASFTDGLKKISAPTT